MKLSGCILCRKESTLPSRQQYLIRKILGEESMPLYCTECLKKLSHELAEDWQFEPRTPQDVYKVRNPKFTMSNMKQVDKEDNELPDYKITADAGTRKTDRVQKKYAQKNQDSSVNGYHFDDPENQIGA